MQDRTCTTPLLTIAVVARNGAATLGALLEALQARPESVELLLVDDGSTDRTAQLAETAGARVVRLGRPGGAAAARQVAVENCRTQWIAFTDADCVPADDWITTLLQHLNPRTMSADVLVGNTITPKSSLLGDCIAALGFPGGGSVGFEVVWPVGPDGRAVTFSTCNCLMRRELFDRFGGFDTDTPPDVQGEDTLLAARWIDAGAVVRYEPALIVRHQPRTSLRSFLHWQRLRGRGAAHLKGRLGSLRRFVDWRRYYLRNLLGREFRKPRGVIVVALLLLGELARLIGYLEFTWRSRKTTPRQSRGQKEKMAGS